MTGLIRISALAFLIIAAIAFATTTYITTPWNWQPVELPLPGAGLEAAEPFTITTSGNFQLEVAAVMPAGVPSNASAEPGSVLCDLQISINRESRPMIRNRFGGSN